MSEKLESKEPSEGDILIDVATNQDIDGILRVQEENLLSHLREEGVNEQEISQRGFLISSLTEPELAEIISEPESHLLLVARNENEVQGYILGYDLDKYKADDPEWEKSVVLNKGLKSLPDGKTLYARHVAVKPGTKGVGGMLEGRFFQEARNRGYKQILAEILREPVKNEKSMAVHKARGFEVIGENPEDGMVWDLVVKDLEK